MNFYLFLIILVLVTTFIYLWLKRRFSYWSSRGIPGPTPSFLSGNTGERLSKVLPDLELEWYQKYGDVYGIYSGFNPRLTICRPDLIKQVLVKDFPLFIDRRHLTTYHPIWNNNLFVLTGDKWKRIRSIVTPAFTSGKLKQMQTLIIRSIEKLDKYFDSITKNGQKNVIQTKEVISGFTIDVIASTTFATETDANNDHNRMNIFVKQALKFFDINTISILCSNILPLWLNKLLGVRLIFEEENFKFFEDLTRQIVRSRIIDPKAGEKKDLVQLLLDGSINEDDVKNISFEHLTATDEQGQVNESIKMQAKPGRGLTEDEMIAQSIIFFVAGFETTATTLTFALYELAVNQDIQDKLVKTILEAKSSFKNDDSYSYCDKILMNIPYLEAVVKETLRKYPPVIRLQRVTGVDGIQLDGIKLEKGIDVEIPVNVVHKNPKYYPDPERFDPERFMPENKDKLIPYTYIPFGIGPRNCVGMRFAYQEIKLCLALILVKYQLKPTIDTPKSIKFCKGNNLTKTIPVPLGISRRNL